MMKHLQWIIKRKPNSSDEVPVVNDQEGLLVNAKAHALIFKDDYIVSVKTPTWNDKKEPIINY